jgi:hypothetical protein
MRFSVRFALGALLLSGGVGAQVLEARPPSMADQWVFSAGAFGGIPLGDFRKHENGGGGWEFMLGFQPFRRQPMTIRAHFAQLIYGNITNTGYQEVCDFFGCTQEEIQYTARSHTMTSIHIGPEFFATDGFIRPFLYALVGTTWFHSSLNEPPTSPGGPSPGSTSLFWSNNMSAAYGAGVRFVGTRFGREMGLELAGRVTRNDKASYIVDGGVFFDSNGDVIITPVNTAAHVLGIHLSFYMGPFINWNERRPR